MRSFASLAEPNRRCSISHCCTDLNGTFWSAVIDPLLRLVKQWLRTRYATPSHRATKGTVNTAFTRGPRAAMFVVDFN
jgi:hypothetical protein